MTLEAAADWAQIVIAVGTLAAVLVAIGSLRATLREVQRDRQERQRPYVLFEQGGNHVPVRELDGVAVPGVDPLAVRELFSDLPADAKAIHVSRGKDGPGSYGPGRNVGNGPAFDIHVVWIAQQVRIGNDRFEITERKREEPLYARGVNDMPLVPRNLAKGESGELTRLPGFAVLDVDRKLSEAHGSVHIGYRDVVGQKYTTEQKFSVWMRYDDDPPHVHVTFGNVSRVPVQPSADSD